MRQTSDPAAVPQSITHRILSLGAGVQSSTLYLLCARARRGDADAIATLGAIGNGPDELPTVAIFADTQWEPEHVYAWLGYLSGVEWERWEDHGVTRFRAIPGEYRGGVGGEVFPVRVVTAGNIRDLALRRGRKSGEGRSVSLPLFVKNQDGARGIIRRQCTSDFKIRPIRKAVRAALGYTRRRIPKRGVLVESWQGISLDEATRMKDSGEHWIANRYPLVDLRWTRHSCLQWMAAAGYPEPPKSACIGCPFTSDARWRQMKETAPGEWEDAVAFDRAIRHSIPGLRRAAYLHDSLQPLDQVDFRTAEDHGQVNMFNNECEGMCGV